MVRRSKDKGLTGRTVKPLKKSGSGGQRIDRSSATKAQELRIIEALRIRPRTTEDFRRDFGIFQISARVHSLRAQGWDIRTDRITLVDRDGFMHPRAALYSLHESEGAA